MQKRGSYAREIALFGRCHFFVWKPNLVTFFLETKETFATKQ